MVQKKPKLYSVIIPLYNRATVVGEALDSVLQQTYRPIEIVVVDDGSSDESAEAVRRWAEKVFRVEGDNLLKSNLTDEWGQGASRGEGVAENPSVGLLHQPSTNPESDANSWEIGDAEFVVRYFCQENAGAPAARNRGIEESRGQYVQFLDSDDHIHPGRLERLAETFAAEQCDFIQTGFEGFDADTGEIIQTLYGKPEENQLDLALTGRFWANTLRAALTAGLVKRIGPWKTEMSCFQDREYMERALCHANRPVAIRDVLASARRGGSERISDRRRSYEGRTWRVFCEEQLAKVTRDRQDVSYAAKQAFASRIYGLGLRSNAEGWKDLGKRCGEIASSMNVRLDALGQRRRLVWRLGRIGGLVYRFVHKHMRRD